MEYRLYIKKTAKWTALGLSCLIVVAAAFWGFVQTGPGRDLFALWTSNALGKATSFQVKVGKITGFIPFHMRIEKLAFSDGLSDWLVVEHGVLDWSPALLIKKRIVINELRAESIRLERIPDVGKEKEKARPRNTSFLEAVTPFYVHRLKVGKFYLGKSILGSSGLFSLDGRLISSAHEPLLTGSLHVDRKDGPKGLYRLDWSLTGREVPGLELHVRAEEDKAGLLTRIAGLKETGAVTLSLEGKGPLDQWKGHLSTTVGGLGTVDADLAFMFEEKLRLKGDGRVTFTRSFVEQNLASMALFKTNFFHFDGLFQGLHALEIHRFSLENEGMVLGATGRLDRKRGEIKSDFQLRADDLSRFGGLVKTKVKGKLVLKGRLSGDIKTPSADLSLKLDHPGFGAFASTNVALHARLTPTTAGPSEFPDLTAQLNGHLMGLSHKTRGPLLPGQKTLFSLKAALRKGVPIDVKELDITGEDFGLRFSGRIDVDTTAVDGNLAVTVNDLARLQNITGRQIRGSTSVEARLKGFLGAGNITADIKGRIDRFEPISAWLAPMMGEEVTYGFHARLEKGNLLKVTDFAARSAEAKMGAEGSLDFSSRNIAAKAHLDLPRLAVFSKPLKRSLYGTLELDLGITKTLDNPEVTARAMFGRLRMADTEISEALVSIVADRLFREPEGNLKVHLRSSDRSLEAATRFTFAHPVLSLSDLRANGSGTELSGDLEFDIKGPRLKGALHGTIADLPSFSSLFGKKIAGTAGFDVVLSETEGRQNASLDLRGKGLISPYGNVEALALRARIGNVFQAPEGKANLELTSFRTKDLEVRHLTLKAQGHRELASFQAYVDGRFQRDFLFETVGSAGWVDRDRELRLTLFQGNFGELAVKARKPLVIRKTPDFYTLDRADLDVGGGIFQASGRLGRESVAFDGRLDGLPLSLLHAFGYPELLGTATARIHAEGKGASPSAVLEIEMRKIQWKDPLFQKLPPASLTARMTLQEHELNAHLSLEDLASQPAKADFHLPVNMTFLPFAFSLRSREDLEGRMVAQMDLERLTPLLLPENQTLKGDLALELAVTGPVEKPRLKGQLRLSRGAYEYATGGTLIKEIELSGLMTEDGFVLQKARATDGEKGRISAEGRLRFDRKRGFPFAFSLNLENAILVRRDDLTAKTDGQLHLNGETGEMKLSGAITVGPAEIRIPESLPPEIRELKVEEINLPADAPRLKRIPSTKKAGRIHLDVAVESPGRVFVRGRGLDSEWKGNLRITGNDRQPVLKGTLSTVRGRYNLFGKPFSLTSGTIDFAGESPPAPRIDVVAEHTRSDIYYRILVEGVPSNLNFNMESDPPMPSDEILANLLFGRSAAHITPFQALRLAQALNSLRGGGSGMFDIMDRTRTLIGVDELNIKQPDEKSGETSVSIGKYMNENVYLEIEQGLGADTGKVSMEIELTPHISVGTDVGANGQSGVGLNWKWDY